MSHAFIRLKQSPEDKGIKFFVPRQGVNDFLMYAGKPYYLSDEYSVESPDKSITYVFYLKDHAVVESPAFRQAPE